jgi:hypothetical protein
MTQQSGGKAFNDADLSTSLYLQLGPHEAEVTVGNSSAYKIIERSTAH